MTDEHETEATMATEQITARLEARGNALARARQDTAAAMKALQREIVAAAAAGMGESEIARRAGVTRMTVRSALGK